jgi:hypothetical protein
MPGNLMNSQRSRLLPVILMATMLGCGGPSGPKLPTPVKVKGAVAMDSQPLSNAMVYFVPEGGKSMGNGATGITDASGAYELVTVVGKSKLTGAIPGNYRVWISRLVGPDGTAVAPNSEVPPADLGAIESLPTRYSDLSMTELRASVTPDGGTIDFSVTSR